jgi:triacylglycerol lipase
LLNAMPETNRISHPPARALAAWRPDPYGGPVLGFRLDPAAPAPVNGYYLGVAAKSAYAGEPSRFHPALRRALPWVVPLNVRFAHGFVAASDQHAVVAFCGTCHPRHVLDSFTYRQVPGYGGRVHKGFSEALDRVWNPLLAALHDVKAHQKTLWLTGHSLGGALATLAAERLREAGFEPMLVCTFGAPRMFDGTAARCYIAPLYRFVTPEDLVPQYPVPGPRYDYRHAGTPVVLYPSGGVAGREPGWLAAARHFRRLAMMGLAGAAVTSVREHVMSGYLARLRRHILQCGEENTPDARTLL